MKSVSFCIAFLLILGLSAQNSEIAQAQKQMEEKNYKAAIQTLQSFENQYDMLNLNPIQKKDYYYILGKSNLELGNNLEGSKAYVEVNKLESMPTFWVKDKSNKEKRYFLDRAEAESFAQKVDGSVKEIPAEETYGKLIGISLNAQLQTVFNQASKKYENKNYKEAADKFTEIYYMMQALNLKGEQYLYNGAISAYQAEAFDQAEDLFNLIIAEEYEGEDPNDNYLENAYRLTAFIATRQENWEKAKSIAQQGLQKFPKNEELNSVMISVLNKTGDDEALIQQLQESIKKDPKNAMNYYNLGVLYSRKDDGFDQSLQYFKKAVDLDASYEDAYLNLARLMVKKDQEFNDAIDNLGTSEEDLQKEDQIIADRKTFYQEMIPYMEKAHTNNPDEKSFMQLLKFAYSGIGDTTNEEKYELLLRN